MVKHTRISSKFRQHHLPLLASSAFLSSAAGNTVNTSPYVPPLSFSHLSGALQAILPPLKEPKTFVHSQWGPDMEENLQKNSDRYYGFGTYLPSTVSLASTKERLGTDRERFIDLMKNPKKSEPKNSNSYGTKYFGPAIAATGLVGALTASRLVPPSTQKEFSLENQGKCSRLNEQYCRTTRDCSWSTRKKECRLRAHQAPEGYTDLLPFHHVLKPKPMAQPTKQRPQYFSLEGNGSCTNLDRRQCKINTDCSWNRKNKECRLRAHQAPEGHINLLHPENSVKARVLQTEEELNNQRARSSNSKAVNYVAETEQFIPRGAMKIHVARDWIKK